MKTDPYKYFMIESYELLDNLNRDILEFEKKQDDPDLLKRLFRYAHTLKGAAHVVGLLHISKLAHSIESVFSRVRDKNLPFKVDDISLILETLGLITDIIETVKEGKPEGSIDTTAILERFKEIEDASTGQAETCSSKFETDKQQSIESNEQVETGNKQASTNNLAPEVRNSKLATQDNGLEVNNIQVASKDPKQKTKSETIRVSVPDVDHLMDQASELITSTARMDQLHTCLKDVSRYCYKILVDYRKIKAFLNRTTGSYQKIGNESYEKLCKLSQKIDMEALYSHILKHTMALDANVEELRQSSDSIYDIIHRIRSIRVSDITHYFEGVVRELSVKLDKKMTLVITGDDVELDRNLLEELKEPINQILRNAAVYGIEDEALRLSKGKDREGVISLDFKKIGDFIHIICQDDGCGIRTEKIREVALQKGFIDEKKVREISHEESLYLIFTSGVSSGDIITEFAGRGVGLDIVKDKVESLRGSITVETEEDKFARFSIKLPLLLNIIDTFLVEAAGQQYLIPLNMVMESGYVLQDEVEFVAGKTVVKLNDSPVSLMWLSDILQLGQKPDSKQIPFVILKSGYEVMALAVDQILGVKRVLVKSLGEQLKDIGHILGGAILSGGHPALVLNVAELFRLSLTLTNGFSAKSIVEESSVFSTPRILAVDDSLTTRVLISGALEAEGYEVTLASSGEEALDIMGENRYDLFVLDVEMPGINGFELATGIRKDPNHKDTPIIILSSLSKDEHMRKGIEVGAQAYIIKGTFDQGIFIETVERLIC